MTYEFVMTICVPNFWRISRALTYAMFGLSTGRSVGVWTTPWSVVKRPRRAAASLPRISKLVGKTAAQPRPHEKPFVAAAASGGVRVPLVAVALVLLSPLAPALSGEPHFDFPLALPDAPLPSAEPACAQGPDDAAFRVLYALPPATLDWYEERVPLVRAGIAAATGVVLESALPFGVDVRLRFVCDAAGEVEVTKVRTTTAPNVATFGSITGELRAMGYSKPNEKYWVLYEGIHGCGGCVGQGEAWYDDRPGPENLHNRGNMYALTYVGNYGPVHAPTATFTNVMLHEASHTMGAVQLSAPHTSGGFHCDDGVDVMCYADGAPGSDYSALACPRLTVTFLGPEMPFDCGNDDYFHPAPAAGSYLASHWNVGAPANRFIESRALG
jgi:hypothetical protein